MTQEEQKNKDLKRAYILAVNRQDPTVFDRLFAPSYVLHILGLPDVHGPEALRKLVSETWQSLSEIQLGADDMIAEGDKVATRWTMRAVHTGHFMGVAPTGRALAMSGTIIDRFVDGKVVEGWESFDMFGALQQMGAIPTAS